MKTLEKIICQSCGMPMAETTDFGTNRDGSRNEEYCHYCYKNGAFTDEGITMEEKIEKNILMAEKMGMPKEEAVDLANTTIPKLKRWQRLDYKGSIQMNWARLLKSEIDHTYKVTQDLLDMVDDTKLQWKPSPFNNWMTMGQLLKHITEACGTAFQGIVTGDWGLPEGMDVSKMSPEEMLPPAEKMPAVNNLAEAKKLLEEDRQLALVMLAQCKEDELHTKPAPVPWDPAEMVLGQRLLHMIGHLNQHKGQLYYYLKLQGVPVNTIHLWGKSI